MENINAFYSPLLQAEGQVKIYEGEFNLKTEEKNYLINGKLYMTFDPTFDIKLKGTTKERNNFIEEENLLLFIPGMLPTRVEVNSSKNGTYFEGNIDQICNSENTRMDRYILYTINYIDFIGSVVKSNEKLYRGGLPLEIEGWSIEIQKRHDYKEKDIFRELKNSHGYNITHIIEIKRADGEDFNKNDASKIVEVLIWLFNISAGRHISMPIEVGLINEEVVYESYQKQLTSPYQLVFNWFPKHKGAVLKGLFYKLYSRFNDKYERRVIKEVIHQYIETLETRFLENKIIHSQIALEKLSYVLLTQRSPEIISTNRFRKNRFRKNLEKALEELPISVDLGGKYKSFEKDFDSGPHLLAEYRNHIAHPSPAPVFEKYSIDKRFLILQLSIYYTELLMLYLIGYNDVHSNRLKFPTWEGNYESLPWNSDNDNRS